MKQKYNWVIRMVTVAYCLYMLFFSTKYSFMALNVFLAYLPVELSFHLERVNKTLFFIVSALWLLFYPNAPYLFTDFFHLEQLPIYEGMNHVFLRSLSGWLSFTLLTVGICVWGLLGMNSFLVLAREWHKRMFLRKIWQKGLVFILINVLSSLAIFVGRFDRLHSVHIITQPIQTIETIFFHWSSNKLGFICLLTIMQCCLFIPIIYLRYSGGKEVR